MAQNKPNFIPSGHVTRPAFYTEIAGRIIAVFEHPATHTNICLEVNADIWNYSNPRDAQGGLVLEYQGSESRHEYGDGTNSRFRTISSAMAAVNRVVRDPGYGRGLADKPVPVSDVHGIRWPDKVAIEREEKARRAYRRANPWRKPKAPFILNDADRKTLRSWGYPEDDLAQIEQAANESIYDVTYADGRKKSVAWQQATNILGRETFLSGIARSAFHWTAERESADGKTNVYFDSGKDSPFRADM